MGAGWEREPCSQSYGLGSYSGFGFIPSAPTCSRQRCNADDELERRREKMEAKGLEAWQPEEERTRQVSPALRAYAAMTTSAARGAVRDVDQLTRTKAPAKKVPAAE